MEKSAMIYVPVRMEPAVLDTLRGIADERSCSVGAVVRWAVRKAVLAEPPGSEMNEGHAVTLDKSGVPFGVQS